ncbi:SAM-dependent methyltransferases [Thiohalobacter thiocyanaticus]|uniref:SAM-dependent methyltransferases n=1 Tax=Thiohalobacter thiocyanaticus TaxID=585455 RepID=A0A1Z4VT88_9GAMM|nr:FkbM family methyltransferase [Thiohalobacter thiocyanaticus]BAZ94548.1 SAM-dependent methyltransferases [Thiohalobacter thiocyanaticus]
MEMKASYGSPQLVEDSRAHRLHLNLMQVVTRVIGPVGRVRGIGIASKIFPYSDALVQIRLSDDALFIFPVYDPYWFYYLVLRKSFESRLQAFLSRIYQIEFSFIDGGANFGYWSALLSSPSWGAHSCVAVEASNETFSVLCQTAKKNESRFECINAALYSSSGNTISFTEGSRHAGRHIVDGTIEKLEVNDIKLFSPSERLVKVVTTSVDDIYHKMFSDQDRVLIKLDVEGAEIEAFKGALDTAKRNSIFIYEDYGSDQNVTRYLINQGFEIYVPQIDGSLLRIPDYRSAVEYKNKNKKDDHNFVAWKTRSDYVCEVLEAAGGARSV